MTTPSRYAWRKSHRFQSCLVAEFSQFGAKRGWKSSNLALKTSSTASQLASDAFEKICQSISSVTEPFASAAALIVVFDTNALLPLLVGKTRRALLLQQAWQDRRFVPVITPPVFDELSRVMRYPRVRQQLTLTEADI